MQSKICKICKVEKDLSEYHKAQDLRFGVSNTCKSCTKIKMQNYYEDNKDKILDKKKKLYAKSDKLKLRNKSWSENNKDKVRKYRKDWISKNRDLKRETNARRRAARKSATPNWLTNQDIELLRLHYLLAQLLNDCTGEEYHVDHIVPLQHESVCGLHVPWNLQVITASENLSKYNYFDINK